MGVHETAAIILLAGMAGGVVAMLGVVAAHWHAGTEAPEGIAWVTLAVLAAVLCGASCLMRVGMVARDRVRAE